MTKELLNGGMRCSANSSAISLPQHDVAAYCNCFCCSRLVVDGKKGHHSNFIAELSEISW
jgi:hypothetical protein